ncbi:MAG: molecular chaperone TorD family protein [Thermodesulfovibrionia bacterium]|nr:molecular chaperone TorD family protein [Thermodesulfovibrionia bacterium]
MKKPGYKKDNSELRDMAKMAIERSNTYGLLSTIYRAEPTIYFLNQIKDPHFLGVLSDLGIQFDKKFLKRPAKKLVEDLAVEYTRLFLGPGKHISPHESVHHERDNGDWGMLWGKSTVEVKKFIESTGLEYKTDFTGMPDHISVELEFMHRVIKEEAEAREKNNIDKVNYCIQIENKFMDEHLSKWIPVFCDKVISHTGLCFYKEMAKVTKHFIEFEKEELKIYISETQKENAS